MELPTTDQPGYRECFVVFLDILGFRKLIARSETDPGVLATLSHLTAVSARFRPGLKETSQGRCPMQFRSFSDCVVGFTPRAAGFGFAPNGLAQLLFVVRFIHDELLTLGASVRGGVTLGKMYWHPSWSRPEAHDAPEVSAKPLTFGPGLVAAYDIESKSAKVPRVLVGKDLREYVASVSSLEAFPFGQSGNLLAFIRRDFDGEHYLDLLHPDVTRSQDERLRLTPDGFAIEWTPSPSRWSIVRKAAEELARKHIHDKMADPCVRGKHQWLLEYAESHAIPETPNGPLAGSQG
jgi:hypothetical protein